MSDLAKWKVHGPVHTLRTESADWDRSRQQWQEARQFTLVRFHRDRRIEESESHNFNGSTSRSSYSYDAAERIQEARFGMNSEPISKSLYFYDEHGRPTRVVSVDRDGTERASEVYSYGQDGKTTKVYFMPKREPETGSVGINFTSLSGGGADEVLLYDADHRLLSHVVFTRDDTGRLLKEEVRLGEQVPFPNLEKELENAPPEAREAASAAFANLFGPKNVMSSTTYTYDGQGRVLERRMRMGQLGGHSTMYRYDDHDNSIEETAEDTSREMRMDKNGNFHSTKENSDVQTFRFDYTYDARGNWTERVFSGRLGSNPNFERSNVERRAITYYAA
jgi:hypothetical protein